MSTTAAADIEQAIATITDSRRTHVEWRDHWLAQPCKGTCAKCEVTARVAGGLEHQERCIAAYDTVLTVLRHALEAQQ